MTTTMKWIIGIVVVAVIIIIAFAGQQKGPEETVPITIGFVGALTGEAAFFGEEDLNSLLLAVEEINMAGGVNGRQIEVVAEDSRCNGKDGATATQKLINVDKVEVILGGTCSGVTLASAPIVEDNKVIWFSSYSSNPDITDAGDYVFRNSPSDTDNARATARLAIRNGIKEIAVIAETTDYAFQFAEVFEEEFTKHGGSVLEKESYVPETTDFRSIVTKIKSTNSEAVLVSSQGESAGFILRQLKELGYTGEIYGSVILSGEAVVNIAEGGAENAYFSDPEELNENNLQAKKFLESYEEKYGKRPGYTYYAGAKYDAAYIIAQAIEEVGLNGSKIKSYLYNLENYGGVLGTTSFDENGDIEGIEFADYQIKNGEAVKL